MTMPPPVDEGPVPASASEPPGSSPEFHPAGTALQEAIAALEDARRTNNLDAVGVADLQRLMAALVNAYCAKRAGGEKFAPLAPDHGVTPTDIMVAASQLLKAGDLQVVELGMWQSWTGE